MTWTDGAMVCLEIDVAKVPLKGIWVGIPSHDTSLYIEIEYETLLAFCSKCHCQGHNFKTCRRKEVRSKVVTHKGKGDKVARVWVPKPDMV